MLLSEAWRSLTANLSTTFAAAITVLIGMALVGMLVGFGTYARSWTDKTKRELVVHVYFCTDQTCPTGGYANGKQMERVRVKLASNPQVKSVRFVSKEHALKQMKEEHPDLVKNVPTNPLPDAFEVTPVKGEYVDRIAASLKPTPAGVEQVTLREEDGAQDPRRRAPDRGALPGRGAHPPARVDASDREHDPPVDLRAPKRGRGDEARRRVELVHPRSVHARGPDDGLHRRAPGCDRPLHRQGDDRLADLVRGRGRASARVPAERL